MHYKQVSCYHKMTSYHGGKQRIGKQIAQKIYDVATSIECESKEPFNGYCEPFCGMCGVYRYIPDLFEEHKPKMKYKAGDKNKSVIMMWKKTQSGWTPPNNCTEEYYQELRYNNIHSAEKGFLGHACSFRGLFCNSYRWKYVHNKKSILQKNSDNVKNMAHKMHNVEFIDGEYTNFSSIKNYIIYCDPPYRTCNKYRDVNRNKIIFDHDKFWKWCKTMSHNNLVFVSEYEIPNNLEYTILYDATTTNRYKNNTNGRKPTEKLYMIK